MVDLAGSTPITGVRVVTLACSGTATGRACHLEAVVMTGPCPITLVLVGTLRARISAVGVGCHMVRLTGPTAITSIGIVTRTGAATTTGRARCCWQVRAQASAGVAGAGDVALIQSRTHYRVAARAGAALTGVGLRAGIAIAAGRAIGHMVGLAGPTAIAGVGIVTRTGAATTTGRTRRLVRMGTDPTTTLVVSALVGVSGAR